MILKAYCNCSNVFLVWQTKAPIENCLGFAVYRRINGEEGVLKSSVGFADDGTAKPGEFHPTTEWPLQRFTWTDFSAPADAELQYRVVPMVGTEDSLTPDEDNASLWTAPFTLTAKTASPFEAYFNDGILATQWIARDMDEENMNQRKLHDHIDTPDDPIRTRLGGAILAKMLELLDGVKEANGQVFCALYELNDAQLIQGLVDLGKHAHVVLSNGSDMPDENKVSRSTLKQHHVDVYDRLLDNKGHLAHNKFMIIANANGVPQSVWTGSTNWTDTGLCTQTNNGLLINDPEIAQLYKKQWDILAKAEGDFPPSQQPTIRQSFAAGGRNVTVSFTPWQAKKGTITDSEPEDLAYAKSLIDQAQDGILFLMFIPGPTGTLLEAVAQRNDPKDPAYDKNLFIRGVVNQDPGSSTHPSVGLFHQGEAIPANFDVLIPEAIDQKVTYWLPEIRKLAQARAIIHSKVVVIDPFGEHPVVITGSHNAGTKASIANDENLVIIERDSALAQQYAVNIITVFNQYWWRFNRMPAKLRTDTPDEQFRNTLTDRQPKDTWKGLHSDGAWQKQYFTGPRLDELNFWLGQTKPITVEQLKQHRVPVSRTRR